MCLLDHSFGYCSFCRSSHCLAIKFQFLFMFSIYFPLRFRRAVFFSLFLHSSSSISFVVWKRRFEIQFGKHLNCMCRSMFGRFNDRKKRKQKFAREKKNKINSIQRTIFDGKTKCVAFSSFSISPFRSLHAKRTFPTESFHAKENAEMI